MGPRHYLLNLATLRAIKHVTNNLTREKTHNDIRGFTHTTSCYYPQEFGISHTKVRGFTHSDIVVSHTIFQINKIKNSHLEKQSTDAALALTSITLITSLTVTPWAPPTPPLAAKQGVQGENPSLNPLLIAFGRSSCVKGELRLHPDPFGVRASHCAPRAASGAALDPSST